MKKSGTHCQSQMGRRNGKKLMSKQTLIERLVKKVSPGVKFGDAELIGVPQIVIVGKGLETGEVDLWNRRTGERRSVKVESALAELG